MKQINFPVFPFQVIVFSYAIIFSIIVYWFKSNSVSIVSVLTLLACFFVVLLRRGLQVNNLQIKYCFKLIFPICYKTVLLDSLRAIIIDKEFRSAIVNQYSRSGSVKEVSSYNYVLKVIMDNNEEMILYETTNYNRVIMIGERVSESLCLSITKRYVKITYPLKRSNSQEESIEPKVTIRVVDSLESENK